MTRTLKNQGSHSDIITNFEHYPEKSEQIPRSTQRLSCHLEKTVESTPASPPLDWLIYTMVINTSRLLVVEDDPNDLELIRLALDDYPFIKQIDVEQDGEGALRYLLSSAEGGSPRPLPRLVLLDLKLPKISGLEVLEAIRNHPRTKQLVVVVMTASNKQDDITACYRLGVNSYVVKPQDSKQLQDLSRRVGVYWMQLNHYQWILS